MTTVTLTATPLSPPRGTRSNRRRQAVSRPAARPTPVQLTHRGRAVAVLLLFLVLAVLAALSGHASVQAATSGDSRPVVTYLTVHPGETLWQIAGRVAPGADRRDTVARIIAVNGLRGGDIAAGERLAVPASR